MTIPPSYTSKAMICTIMAFLFFTTVPHALAQEPVSAEEFLKALNTMRAAPSAFIPTVDAFVREWRSFVPDKNKLESAANELKRELKKQKPLAAFTTDSNLVSASRDHARDGRQMGVLGHIGSDKSTPVDRVNRYTSEMQRVSEVITYGQATAEYMLAAFLIDEQDPKRGHRKALLSNDLTFVGATVDSHPKYRTQIVVVLGRY